MNKSSILSCFALFLLLELTLAKVKLVKPKNGPNKAVGCEEPYDQCDDYLSQNRCCNGAQCVPHPVQDRSFCSLNQSFNESVCGQRLGQCDRPPWGAGCCSELDECNCNENDSAICACLPCLEQHASCKLKKDSCCGDMFCQCDHDENNCVCTAPPPTTTTTTTTTTPRPCKSLHSFCVHRNNECCPGLGCFCDRHDVTNCHCFELPPQPPQSCIRRDQQCDQNNDRCCCTDHCIYVALGRSYECKRKPASTWNINCSNN